mgnify:CR=1 FL=1
MLNQAAFANSLAILTGALYILFYLVSLFAPQFLDTYLMHNSWALMWPRFFPKKFPSVISFRRSSFW